MDRRGWIMVIGVAAVLALASLASNWTTESQMSGEADTLLAVRSTVSSVVNAGAVWGGLAVLAGWLVRRPAPAAAAGVVALLTACAVHYGAGRALGMFDPEVWTANSFWFLAAVVTGGPLGLVGATARRLDPWGTAARLVVPAGAVLEPFVLGRFTGSAILPWPARVADIVSGLILLTAGVSGCFWALTVHRRRQTAPARREAAVER